MDITLFSNILKELILENERVSLPGMGSFIAEMAPSVFSDRALVIHPPFRRILFRSSESWNDGLLEGRYAKERGVAEDIAKHEITEFVKRLKVDLSTNKTYKIPGFGTMRATEQNDYFFVADKDLFNYVEGYGLAPINIKVLSKKGEVEKLSGKPVERFFKGIPKDLLGLSAIGTDIESIIDEAGSEEFDPEVITEPQMEEVIESEISADNSERGLEDLISIDEDLIQEPQQVIAPKPEPVKVTPPKPEPVIATAPKVQPVAATAPKVQPVAAATPKAEDKKGGNKFVKRFITILVLIFLLIAVIALLIVFKDELRPILEWILYSKEEREILKLS
jgi:nucleoid DNA-binding protein